MNVDSVKKAWKAHYGVAPVQLKKMKEVAGVATVFNSNIDAVIKVTPEKFQSLVKETGANETDLLKDAPKRIETPSDLLRGILHCFRNGIAEEWLIREEGTFQWAKRSIGYDVTQMGGQGGIIANVMSVCGVQQVYVHCASLPEEQARLFLDRPNLLSANAEGGLEQASKIARQDEPLIHWILEFDKRAEISLAGQTFVCPKSNRFIATFDPLNFVLHIDEPFSQALSDPERPLEVVLLSGYHMLTEPMANGESGIERVKSSRKLLQSWKAAHPDVILHFEVASTQDAVIRKSLIENIAPQADSIGCNEQELIDILEVMGETDLAEAARKSLDSVSLFKGLQKVFEALQPPRIQLHMYGLYITLAQPDYAIPSESIRNGMVFAATLAASKAGTGSIEHEENLLWSHGREIGDVSVNEIKALAEYAENRFNAKDLAETGFAETDAFRLIAVPTVLINKPLTLVGMGDTISSLSLVGAR
ncbi:MAG: hypothetical protein O3B01_02505 [Planctomycetota bacterium]|nr:hypothetical protein [Planctomycetota bacterium]MDA1137430.1 hypothetical protein [Planctomycetota bacterium]